MPLAFEAPQSSPGALSQMPGRIFFGGDIPEQVMWMTQSTFEKHASGFGAPQLLEHLQS